MDSAVAASYYTDSFGTCTINMSINGAGGLDTGAIAANTWYNVYAISSGSALSCLASTSATSPTMPAGYVFRVRLGAMKTNSGAATLWPTYQQGNTTRFTAALSTAGDRVVVSGASGTCGATMTTSTVSVWGSMVPATAKAAMIGLNVSNSQAAVFQAPMSTAGNTTVPGLLQYSSGVASIEYLYTYSGAATVNECSQIGSTITVNGWVDAVNAN
jgi:hypothetical protein